MGAHKPVICTRCGNWFIPAFGDCKNCAFAVPEPPPFKLTHDDWVFLKTNRIQPWENEDNDDGA